MYQISLIPKEQMHSIIPLLRILNDKIDDATLFERLEDMMQKNYACAGVYDEGRLIGICGLWILNKYYVGKHIEPDNVMILPEYRNKKVGGQMMEWVYEYGRSQGCIASELNCYVVNDKGIRFWLNQGYKIIGFHCQKTL